MLRVKLKALKKSVYARVFQKHPFLRKTYWAIREKLVWRFIRKGDLIKVELSASCNARCSFCWMFQSEIKPNGLMSLENFKRFIDLNRNDFVRRRVRIQPFFNGEALIHPHFFEIIDYIVQNRIRLARLDTNLGVKKDMRRLMSYPWPVVCVNLGGVTKEVHERVMKTPFETVVENLRQVFQINKKKVFVKMTPVKSNIHQIKLFPSFVKQLGGDPGRVEIGTTGFNTPALASEEELKNFFAEVVSPEVDPYLRFTYDLHAPRYGIRAKKPGCHFLVDCITYDGKLTICCQDQFGTLNTGNAFDTPYFELKNSPRYKKTYQLGMNQKFKMCEECN